MPKSVEVEQKFRDSTRCVGIEIWNKRKSHNLIEPATYVHSGQVQKPCNSPISPGQNEVCIFFNTPPKEDSAVGVLSYKLCNTQISLLVSNPDKGDIEYALYFPNEYIKTDNSLYNKMYNKQMEPNSFIGREKVMDNSNRSITKESIHVNVTAKMPSKKKVILKVDVKDK